MMKNALKRCCHNTCTQFTILTLVVIPSITTILALFFGGIIASYEEWTFATGFEYSLSIILRMAAPLTSAKCKTSNGEVTTVFLSVLGFMVFGYLMNAVNSFQIGDSLARRFSCTRFFCKCVKGHDKRLFVECLTFLLLIFPVMVTFGALVTGDILASLNGWTLWEGLLWVYGNTLNAPQLFARDYEMINSGTKIFGVLAQILNLTFAALALDYVVNLHTNAHMIGTTYDEQNIPSSLPTTGGGEVSHQYAIESSDKAAAGEKFDSGIFA